MIAVKGYVRFLIGMTAVLMFGAAGQPVLAADAPTKMMNGMLVDSGGMTLYTFDKDPKGAGKSACNGGCTKNWPPLMAKDSDKASGDYSVITRDDGSKQWAYNGKPLYTWAKDKKPGDMTGDNFKDVWHVVH